MNKVSIGNSGEYFVAGELERRGYTCAVPMSNTKDFDILAINRKTYTQYAIQVKTNSGKNKKWILSEKNENLVGNNIIYILVNLNELEQPVYHIVSSVIVAKEISTSHKNWLNTLAKSGDKHSDNKIRIFEDKENRYIDNWDILK